MKITVAVCTYNPRRDTLVRALDAISAQLDDVQSEVIVIDNNSSPPLAGFHELERYPVRLIVEPRAGLTAAREAVISNAEGDVIVFVDDDNILGRRYLATVAEAFTADPYLGLLGGSVIPEYETTPQKWFQEFEPWLAVRRYGPELWVETTELPVDARSSTQYFPVGAGFAIRRDLAVSYQKDCMATMRIEGRHGSTLSSGEDLDLGLYILSQGSKLVVTGSLGLTHVISGARTTSKYLQRLAIGNVKSSLALERKWSARLGQPIYPIFSISIPSLLLRTVVTTVMGLGSRRYRVKRAVYVTLARLRLAPQTHTGSETRRLGQPSGLFTQSRLARCRSRRHRGS